MVIKESKYSHDLQIWAGKTSVIVCTFISLEQIPQKFTINSSRTICWWSLGHQQDRCRLCRGKARPERVWSRAALAIIHNASAEKLKAFLEGKIEPESAMHTDGWRGYDGLENSGFKHIGIVAKKTEKTHITFLFNRRKAHKISHTFQRLMEGAVREQARPFWQIVGRTANNFTMKSEITLEDILAAAKARVME